MGESGRVCGVGGPTDRADGTRSPTAGIRPEVPSRAHTPSVVIPTSQTNPPSRRASNHRQTTPNPTPGRPGSQSVTQPRIPRRRPQPHKRAPKSAQKPASDISPVRGHPGSRTLRAFSRHCLPAELLGQYQANTYPITIRPERPCRHATKRRHSVSQFGLTRYRRSPRPRAAEIRSITASTEPNGSLRAWRFAIAASANSLCIFRVAASSVKPWRSSRPLALRNARRTAAGSRSPRTRARSLWRKFRGTTDR
jgi:hypothetical protein